jgi:PKD repeat protein
MKNRIIFLITALALVLTSCLKRPDAGFSASNVVIDLGETIEFTNISHDAVEFEWDFGDGTTSTDVNPVHRYDYSGNFKVELKAFSDKDIVDRAYMDITVLPEYVLDIIVKEYYDEYVVPGASVILYPTYQDWLDETNAIVDGYTDNDGIVVFSGLDDQSYYLDVWEAHHDNYTLAAEDVAWIETNVLSNTEINYFTAWVDYYDTKKSKSPALKLIRVEGPKREKK